MEDHETTPLLTTPPQQENTPTDDSGKNGREEETVSLTWKFLPQWSSTQWRIMICGSLTMLSINFGEFMATPAQLQIFEDIICQNYVRSINGTAIAYDDICKSLPVQEELSLVMGWKKTFDILPSIILSLPYGVLADKIGRRPVFIMSLSSLLCSEVFPRIICWFNLPLRLVWLAGLFQVVGGGDLVASSILMAVIADAFSAEERSTALFRITAAAFVAEIVATPLCAVMMESGPWKPWILAMCITVSSGFFMFIMPETLHKPSIEQVMQEEEEASEDILQDSEMESPMSPVKNATVLDIVVSKAQEYISSSRFIWTQPRMLVSIITVFAGSLDKSSWFLFIQYISIKFRWSISQASMVVSIRGCMTLATLLVVVPVLSSFLIRKLHYDAIKKDLYIARLAAGSGVVGYFMVAIASTAPLLVLGTLFMSFSMPFTWSIVSVATSFVPPQQIATLYAAMSVSRSIGAVVAGPMFAILYGWGMQLGTEWSGLPFAAGSFCSLLILIAVAFITVQSAARPAA